MQKNKSVIIRNSVAVKEYAIFQQANPKFRNYMEDTSFIYDCFLENCPKSLLFGVFDGHGGSLVSIYLQKYSPEIIKDHYKKHKGNQDQRSIFEKAFQILDAKIQTTLQKSFDSGSTATIGLITLEQSKRVLHIANVGDSTGYIFDDNFGEKLTPDHRADNPQQVKRFKETGGKLLNNRVCGILAVTRAFGDFALKTSGLISKPDYRRIQLRLAHKYIVVASDGLWDFVDPKEVHKVIKSEIEAPDISRVLIKTAIQKGSVDNITVTVIRL